VADEAGDRRDHHRQAARAERRRLTQQQIMDEVRESLKSVGDARVSVEAVERMSAGGGRQGMLQVSVQGPKTAPLEQLAEVTGRMVDGLRETPGVVDLDTTFEGGKPQVSVAIDRERAADLASAPRSSRIAVCCRRRQGLR
jgi:HAE1 family hydrophobic/amphiphilic exporter-1